MYKRIIPKYKILKNIKLQNYLEQNGIYPVGEWDDEAMYEITPQYLSLLDSYYIQYHIVGRKNF